MSMTSSKTYMECIDIETKSNLVQTQKVMQLSKTLERLEKNMKWVQIRLSHHVVQ